MSGCIGGSCVARKWAGMGTTVEKPTNAALAKENNDRFAQMLAERTKQDTSLNGGEPQRTVQTTAIEIPVFEKQKTRGF